MTADNDFVRLNMDHQTANISLDALGFEWPPPEYIYLDQEDGFRALSSEDMIGFPQRERKFVMKRVSMSIITDEQIVDMDHVARGADYKYIDQIKEAS